VLSHQQYSSIGAAACCRDPWVWVGRRPCPSITVVTPRQKGKSVVRTVKRQERPFRELGSRPHCLPSPVAMDHSHRPSQKTRWRASGPLDRDPHHLRWSSQLALVTQLRPSSPSSDGPGAYVRPGLRSSYVRLLDHPREREPKPDPTEHTSTSVRATVSRWLPSRRCRDPLQYVRRTTPGPWLAGPLGTPYATAGSPGRHFTGFVHAWPHLSVGGQWTTAGRPTTGQGSASAAGVRTFSVRRRSSRCAGVRARAGAAHSSCPPRRLQCLAGWGQRPKATHVARVGCTRDRWPRPARRANAAAEAEVYERGKEQREAGNATARGRHGTCHWRIAEHMAGTGTT